MKDMVSESVDLIEFAAEFVETARSCIDEAPGIKREIFTSRKSQAICSMGIARILRQGQSLDIPQLVNLAVITTPPEAQSYAEMIALRILLDQPDPTKDIFFEQFENQTNSASSSNPSAPNMPQIPPHLAPQALLLQEIMDFLHLNQSVDVSKDLDALKFLDDFEKKIFSRPVNPASPSAKSTSSYANDLDRIKNLLAYQRLGGRSEILNQKIRSEAALQEAARQNLLQSVPFIDDEGLIASHVMGMQDSVKKLSRESRVHNALDLLQQTEKLDQRELETLLDNMTHKELTDNLELMQKYQNFAQRYDLEGHPMFSDLSSVLSQMESFLRENLQTFDDILRFPSIFSDNLTREEFDKVLDQSKDFLNPEEFMQKAKMVDERLNTDFLHQGLDRFPEYFEAMDYQDLLNNPVPSAEWEELFYNAVSSFINQPMPPDYQYFPPDSSSPENSTSPENSSVEGSSSEKAEKSNESTTTDFSSEGPAKQDSPDWMDQRYLRDLIREKVEESTDPVFQSFLQENLNRIAQQMIANASNREQLEESVMFARQEDLFFDLNYVRKKGKQFGMTSSEIAKLIGSIFDYVKMQLPTNDINFNEMQSYMEKGALNQNDVGNLAPMAVKYERINALGSMAHMHLDVVLDNLPQDEKGSELMDQALGTGTGENLLFNWFSRFRAIPPAFRDIIKKHARRILIDLAKTKASSLIGSSEAGALPEGTTRPYVLGDDPDAIDLAETIDNILDTGKRLEDVSIDDFIIRKEVTGRRCVIFLVDISGSMNGIPLASASLATAMLLFAFSRDELGVALFESNTHVLCDISKPVEIDEVVDEILDLRAQGGTQMSKALDWAQKQFEISRSKDRILIMVTDAQLGDFRECQNYLERFSDMGVSSALVVPPNLGFFGNIQALVESANASLIPVENWKNFPEIVSKILSRV